MSNIKNIKIIRKIEDINEDCWCRLTEENFNIIKKIGYKTSYDTFSEYISNSNYDESKVFYLPKGIKYAKWYIGSSTTMWQEIKFELEEEKSEPKNPLDQYGFKNPNGYNVEILKVYENNGQKEYVGVIILKNNIFPMKWDYEGKSLTNDWNFNLEPIEYKQRLYTKPNNEGFLPKQKFKVSWTRDMSSSLESTGWRLATNEEIEKFKN